MRSFHFLSLLICLMALACKNSQPPHDFAADIKDLIRSNSIVEAMEMHGQHKDKLFENDSLAIEGILHNALFRNEEAILSLNQFFALTDLALDDSSHAYYLGLLIDSQVKAFHYGDAQANCRKLLVKLRPALDEASALDYENLERILEGLSALPHQEMSLPDQGHFPAEGIQIPFVVDKAHLKRIPVRSKGQASAFVFDTGANFSTISQSTAEAFGLEILAEDISVMASTGIEVNTRFAAADSLWIEGILFQHVVFIVLPDSALAFPQIDYQIEGIIGFPVIAQMGRIRLENSSQQLSVLGQTSQKSEVNMFVKGLDLVLAAKCDRGKLDMFLDTGAKYSDLSHVFYLKHRDWVSKNGILHKRTVGGAGGSLEYEVYTLYDFPIEAAGQKVVLDSIDVATQERSGKDYDGAIGQDFINQFDQLTLDFVGSRVDLK